jgi:hypothetical protein
LRSFPFHFLPFLPSVPSVPSFLPSFLSFRYLSPLHTILVSPSIVTYVCKYISIHIYIYIYIYTHLYIASLSPRLTQLLAPPHLSLPFSLSPSLPPPPPPYQL